MKKVSTVAAKPSKKIWQQKLTVGLDLGDRNSWYCVLDESGQIQLEQRVRTNAKALREVFGEMAHSRIGLEIGTHSPWVSRLLSELGHEVIVANARKVRLIGESRKKDDRLDAQTLARLARIDPQLLYPVKHRSAQAQADLMMIRARAGLVRARTGLVNTARGLAKSYGERLQGCNVRNMNPERNAALICHNLFMCGRYRLSRRKQIVEEYFDTVSGEEEWTPRYNIAPTQSIPIIRQNPTKPVRELSLVRWGLIPSWAKDASVAAQMINARSETAATKPALRDALQSRRCLIPADGFYEWQKTGNPSSHTVLKSAEASCSRSLEYGIAGKTHARF